MEVLKVLIFVVACVRLARTNRIELAGLELEVR